MKVTATDLPGLLVIEPRVFRDERGWFYESYHAPRYEAHGVPAAFLQDNHSLSSRGTLRGLHYQFPRLQGKLVQVTRGEVWDVAVDIRRGSPTFGRWFGVVLSDENRLQVWVPPGYAHGFLVLSDEAEFVYKCTEVYHPEDDRGILWNDPELAIPWPAAAPTLSEKDWRHPALAEAELPPFDSSS
ncbi:MAG: dTDP-4-dehydrorhamnose 3,5-epimerase [Planctomycetes bacterium]|nr:dTDP-4-dehydrorhamnose 3,5-epimerase [Planctomycetota bacterium]